MGYSMKIKKLLRLKKRIRLGTYGYTELWVQDPHLLESFF